MTLTLDRPVGEHDEVYRLVVDEPARLSLSGAGIVAVDTSAGVYEITVASGASSVDLTVNATAGDSNHIVDAVRISVDGVLYAEDGTNGCSNWSIVGWENKSPGTSDDINWRKTTAQVGRR